MTWRTLAVKFVRLVIVVLLVTFFSFGLMKLLPGDLVNFIIPFGTPQQKAALRHNLQLDKPMIEQYWHWLSGFFSGNLGRYYQTNQTVAQQLSKALPVSLLLMLYAQVLALLLAIPLGVYTAYKAGSKVDGAVNTTAFAFLALPSYVLGFLLVIYLGARWHVLPTGGYTSPTANLGQHIRYMILPTISLALGQVAVYMRLLRSDMIATLQENFITTAKAKGITDRRILFRHALRPSSLTLLTVAGLNVGALIGGAVIIEVIFQLPGVGFRLYQAIYTHELVALQSYIAIIAIGFVVVNFIVDILYTVLDPRIRDV